MTTTSEDWAPMEIFKQLVEKARQLRSESEKAEARFFAFLMTFEREHESAWRAAGCSHFDQVINSNQLCKTERYHWFVEGVNRIGLEAALEMGYPATAEAGKRQPLQPEFLEAYKERVVSFISNAGVVPSEETAHRMRLEVEPSSVTNMGGRRVDELSKLRAENAKLRADLAAANSIIKRLNGELETKKGKKGGREAA